jgi:hypothetical protein
MHSPRTGAATGTAIVTAITASPASPSLRALASPALEPRFVRRALREDLVYCRKVWSSVPNARGPLVAAAPAAVPSDYPGTVGRRFDRPSTGGTRHRSSRRERLEHARTQGQRSCRPPHHIERARQRRPVWANAKLCPPTRKKTHRAGEDSADPSNGRRNSNGRAAPNWYGWCLV